MSFEGVMVSYNYSEDGEHSNILTVSASGIKFSNRWVLTHGSLLSPLKQASFIKSSKGKPILNESFYENLPEIYVTCEKENEKTPSIYAKVESLSRERASTYTDLEHPSYQNRVLTGRICHVWQCPILERCVEEILYSWSIGHRSGDLDQQTPTGKLLLSVFILVDLDSGQEFKTIRPLSELLDLVRAPPERGSTVEVHSTPFGCEVFLNAVSHGWVCGSVGRRPTLLLTDAATALGCEGGAVLDTDSKELIGIVVCSVSWWRGEWVGLTLVAPLVSVLSAKLRVALPSPMRQPLSTEGMEVLDAIDRSTVLVRCGSSWGAGLYLGEGFVLTCAHVVKLYNTYKVSVYCGGTREAAIVRYKTTDDRAYDVALLYTNPHRWTQLKKADFAEEEAQKGEAVLVAGYPYFSESSPPAGAGAGAGAGVVRPVLTRGHISSVSPSLLHTSCCVQSGNSGGPIFRIVGRRPLALGVIVSNARAHTGACFPYVNMAVPVAAIGNTIQQFMKDRDVSKLSAMESNKEVIQSQWRLLPYRSKI